ncbi:MAG: hypothetical protein HUK22_07545, partial [Thermoguttaceae bacterium]|nr:hypothetical protein [Thermoguttaceae bacterium]
AKILEESAKYGFQYAIVEAPPYTITAFPEAMRRFTEFAEADLVYQNEQFYVFQFDKSLPTPVSAAAAPTDGSPR